jgi:uncharacterized integral membrane protein
MSDQPPVTSRRGRAPTASEPAAPAVGKRLPRRPTWRRRWTVRLVLAAAALAVLTPLAAANFVHVELRLLVWAGDVRLAWALLAAAALGFALGRLAPRRRR